MGPRDPSPALLWEAPVCSLKAPSSIQAQLSPGLTSPFANPVDMVPGGETVTDIAPRGPLGCPLPEGPRSACPPGCGAAPLPGTQHLPRPGLSVLQAPLPGTISAKASPAQKALPLLFADTSFVTIGGLVQGTTFPYSQPSQRPSQGTLWPVFSFPRGTPGARLGVAGPCWVTPGSSRSLLQVAEISLLAGWAPAALCVLLGLGPHLGRTPPSCSHHAGQPLC